MSIGDLDIPGNQITIEANINRTTPYYGGYVYAGDVVSKHLNPTNTNYLLRPGSAEISTTNGYFITPDVCPINLNQTYHVAMVYDGAVLKFYRDGFLMSQIKATGNLIQNNFDTRVGFYAAQITSEQLIGYTNEVRIWNVARTQSQLQNYMYVSLPNPSTQVGLMAYYTFDNLLNKQGNTAWNGTLNGGASINATNPSCIFLADSCGIVSTPPVTVQSSFTTSDTVCVNSPLTITNNTVGATSYYWNFCTADINQAPIGTNLGNVGNLLQKPVYIDYVYDNGSYYGFSTNNFPGKLLRLDFGNSLLNTPTVTDLGTVNGVIQNNTEGIQIIKNNNKWYLEIVGGDITGGIIPYLATVQLGTNITNNNPTGTNWGNLGNLGYPHDLYVFEDNNIWYGITANFSNNTVTRFTFSSDLTNTPTAINLGNVGNIGGPTGVQAIQDNNSLWHVFVTNASSSTLTRLDFGSSLLNTPTGVNLGNINNKLNVCWDVYIIKYCSTTLGYVINAANDIVKLDFNGDLLNAPTATSFGNVGNLSFPHCLSKLFRVGADVYSFITNVNNNTLTRLKFPGCTNSNLPNSTLQNPPAITYNTPGIYNINLTVDDGLPTQSSYCKQVVVLAYPTINAGADTNICKGSAIQLKPATSNATSFQWSPATYLSNPNIAMPVATPILSLQYIVSATNNGFCGVKDTINIIVNKIDSVRFNYNAINCSNFNFNGLGYSSSSSIKNWLWTFGDGTNATVQNTTHNYLAPGTFMAKLIVTDQIGCTDSISKNLNVGGVGSYDFTYKQDVCNPLSIQFNNSGTITTGPYWSFGDGATNNTSLNPTHIYATAGNYNVKYYLQNGSCTDTLQKNITIAVLQNDIVLTHDTTICFGTTKQLLTQPALNFCWSPTTFLNNANSANPTTSTTKNITYYFNAEIPGDNLIVNGDFNAGNTGFSSAYNYANPNVTEGQYFVGTSPQAWNQGVSNCPDHTTGNGNMMIINGAPVADVEVWKETVATMPNTNYVFSTWVEAISVANPAQLRFSINGINVGNQIAASLPTCTWTKFYTTWNSGNSLSATISLINKNTAVAGNDFALDDIVFAPIVINRDSVVITVEKPMVSTNNDTSFCAGGSAQLNASGAQNYSWLPTTNLSNANIANPLAYPTLTTQYIVTGTTINGCMAQDTVNIIIKPIPVITKTNDTTICHDKNIQLFAAGGNAYSWTPTIGLSNAAIANPVASPTANTIFYVTVVGVNTCQAKDSVRLTVTPLTVFSIDPNTSICFNTPKQLNAYGGNKYVWSPSTGLSDSSIANPFSTLQATTTYTVKATSTTCGDTASLQTTLTVLDLPVMVAKKSNDISCSIGSSQLISSGAAQYSWTPIESLDNPMTNNPFASPITTTIYMVTGKGQNGCTDSTKIVVNVSLNDPSGYYMANAFTPNGDGVNDCFGIKYWGKINTLQFAIYDRYGKKVFYTESPTGCWDGTFNGEKQPSGAYIYHIIANTNCGTVEKKSTILLIR